MNRVGDYRRHHCDPAIRLRGRVCHYRFVSVKSRWQEIDNRVVGATSLQHHLFSTLQVAFPFQSSFLCIHLRRSLHIDIYPSTLTILTEQSYSQLLYHCDRVHTLVTNTNPDSDSHGSSTNLSDARALVKAYLYRHALPLTTSFAVITPHIHSDTACDSGANTRTSRHSRRPSKLCKEMSESLWLLRTTML